MAFTLKLRPVDSPDLGKDVIFLPEPNEIAICLEGVESEIRELEIVESVKRDGFELVVETAQGIESQALLSQVKPILSGNVRENLKFVSLD